MNNYINLRFYGFLDTKIKNDLKIQNLNLCLCIVRFLYVDPLFWASWHAIYLYPSTLKILSLERIWWYRYRETYDYVVSQKIMVIFSDEYAKCGLNI